MKKQINKAAIFLEIFIIVFIIAIFFSSFGHTPRAVRLPLIICGITFLLVCIDLIPTVREKGKKQTIEQEKAQQKKVKEIDLKLTMKLIGTTALILLSLALWQITGYLFGSIISIIALGLFLGIKKRAVLIIVSIATSFSLYFIFGVILRIPLSWGFLPVLF